MVVKGVSAAGPMTQPGPPPVHIRGWKGGGPSQRQTLWAFGVMPLLATPFNLGFIWSSAICIHVDDYVLCRRLSDAGNGS